MRAIDWDKAQEIFDRLGGSKPTIEEWTEQFDQAHVFSLAIEEAKREFSRDIVHRLNKEAREEGRFEEQFFNFIKTNEEGEKEQYYEQFDKATAKELAQLSAAEFRKANRQLEKAFEIHDRARKKYGREYTKLLGFKLPARPASPATASP